GLQVWQQRWKFLAQAVEQLMHVAGIDLNFTDAARELTQIADQRDVSHGLPAFVAGEVAVTSASRTSVGWATAVVGACPSDLGFDQSLAVPLARASSRALRTLGGDIGRSVKRTPVALAIALAMAAIGGTIGVSPTPRTP